MPTFQPELTSPDLPRSSPEAQGVSSNGLIDFITTADGVVNSIHSFMLVRHGHIVAEAWWKPEGPEKPHVMWSLSKSFASTAVGMAVDDELLTIHDRVVDFFPDLVPVQPSQNLSAMRVIDLLTMTTGHEVEPALKTTTDWVAAFLEHPVPFKPGTHFQYNSYATFMLSAIVQKLTGQTLLEYLKPRLFRPLGIENPQWDANPQGISLGGWGLHIRTEDIAKFGQLYLQKGMWQGGRLISERWVEMATSKQVSNGSNPASDWDQGYGFQFWRCRHNAFRGDGRNGQFCVVIPELDAVVAMTAETQDLQAQLALVWDKLLPALHSKILAVNPQEEQRLREITSHLLAGKPLHRT